MQPTRFINLNLAHGPQLIYCSSSVSQRHNWNVCIHKVLKALKELQDLEQARPCMNYFKQCARQLQIISTNTRQHKRTRMNSRGNYIIETSTSSSN